MNNEKMIKTAKISYTIINVIQKVIIAAIVLIALAAVIMAVAWKTGVPIVQNVLTFGNVSLELSEQSAVTDTTLVPRMLLALGSGAIMAGILLYGVSILKGILKPMKEGRPFDTNVSGEIKKLGYVVLAGGFLQQFTEMAGYYMFQNYEILQSLFRENVIEKVTINNEINLNFLIVALVLFLLAHVFSYGEELQRQSDETL